jgi:hypothetical protein
VLGVLCDVGRAESLSEDVCLDEEVAREATKGYHQLVDVARSALTRALTRHGISKRLCGSLFIQACQREEVHL